MGVYKNPQINRGKRIGYNFQTLMKAGLTDREVDQLFGNGNGVNGKILVGILSRDGGRETLENRIENLRKRFSEEDVTKIIKRYPHVLGYRNSKVNEKFTAHKRKGIGPEDVRDIVRSNPKFLSYSVDGMGKKIDVFLEFGINPPAVKELLKQRFVVSCSPPVLKEKLIPFWKYGFSPEQIEKITLRAKSIFSSSGETNSKKLDQFKRVGFTKVQARKMVSLWPQIIDNAWHVLDNCIERIQNLPIGVMREEAMDVMLRFPGITSYSKRKLGDSIDEMRRRRLITGRRLTLEETKRIFIGYPLIVGQKVETISKKMDLHLLLAKKCGFDLTEQPLKLIFGRELILKRMKYLRQSGIKVDRPSKIYCSRKVFAKRFGVEI